MSSSHAAGCSFVQHPSKGASAAISLVSWDASATSLQLAVLHQPLHPALPAMHTAELQEWQGCSIVLEPKRSTAAEAAYGAGGAQPLSADPAAVSSVIQAWHSTGIYPGQLPMRVVYLSEDRRVRLKCFGWDNMSGSERLHAWGICWQPDEGRNRSRVYYVYDHHQQPSSSIPINQGHFSMLHSKPVSAPLAVLLYFRYHVLCASVLWYALERWVWQLLSKFATPIRRDLSMFTCH